MKDRDNIQALDDEAHQEGLPQSHQIGHDAQPMLHIIDDTGTIVAVAAIDGG